MGSENSSFGGCSVDQGFVPLNRRIDAGEDIQRPMPQFVIVTRSRP